MSVKDRAVEKTTAFLIGLGVPALILVMMMSINGLSGAAAFTVAISTLGGPFGMVGGFVLSGALAIISFAGASAGYSIIIRKMAKSLLKTPEDLKSAEDQVDKYKLSKKLKAKLKETLRRSYEAKDEV